MNYEATLANATDLETENDSLQLGMHRYRSVEKKCYQGKKNISDTELMAVLALSFKNTFSNLLSANMDMPYLIWKPLPVSADEVLHSVYIPLIKNVTAAAILMLLSTNQG